MPPPATCDAVPATGCHLASPLRSTLVVKDASDDGRDSFKWTWKGAATAVDEFMDPVNGSPILRVCVYDASGNAQPVMQAQLFAPGGCEGSCWRPLGPNGAPFGYKGTDRSALPNGITSAVLRSGSDGRAKLQIAGRGGLLTTPDLPFSAPVTVQLLIGDANGAECWSTTFSVFKRNEETQFKAKGP